MKLPEKLTKCPRTPECTSRSVFRDEEGNLYRLDVHDGFVEHKCHTRGSEKPGMVFLAEWYSNKTGRTRWVGPERMRKTVEKAPQVSGLRRKGLEQQTEWVLKAVYISDLKWKPAEKG